MNKNKNIFWVIISIGYLVCCTVIDLFPHFGAPDFRYTGSDPMLHVWNLGWPLALFIIDSHSGLHIGPFVAPVLGIQFVLFAVVAGAVYFIKKNKTEHAHSL